MNDPFIVIRIILAILFGGYQFWAFRNNKSLIEKLSPMIIAFIVSLFMIALGPIVGLVGYHLIFVILLIELSLIGIILVVVIELAFTLFGANRSIKKAVILALASILLVVVYYLGQRVF